MLPNLLVLAASALIPMIIGAIWFHPSLFGGENWYNLAKLTGKDRSDVSTVKLLSTLILNFFIAFGLFVLCVHQFSIYTTVGGDASLLQSGIGAEFIKEYGNNHLTFGHGFMHGAFQPILLFVTPILGYVCIFEKKSFKYFLVYLGYWIISLGLMGGVIGQWGAVAV